MAEETNATPVKKSKKGLILGSVVLLLVVAGGVGLWMMFSSSKPAEAADAPPPKKQVRTVIHLEGFVVNLADEEERSFLRIGIDLGSGREFSSGHGSKAELPTAAVRDAILSVLSTWRSADLLTPDGKDKLKQQILARLGERVPEVQALEVYFTDFLVQR